MKAISINISNIIESTIDIDDVIEIGSQVKIILPDQSIISGAIKEIINDQDSIIEHGIDAGEQIISGAINGSNASDRGASRGSKILAGSEIAHS